MPKAPKRKTAPQPSKTAKRAKTAVPYWMKPLRDRPDHPSLHTKKKDGTCRKDCKQCEERAFDEDALNDPEHEFHELYVVREKGRDGSPTYDKGGYELDYDKVSDWFKPVSIQTFVRRGKASWGKTGMEYYEQQEKEEQKMARIFYEPGAAPAKSKIDPFMVDAWKAKVEEDIGVPFHKIGLAEFQLWEKKGFPKAKRGDYSKLSDAEMDKLMIKTDGASLRKD